LGSWMIKQPKPPVHIFHSIFLQMYIYNFHYLSADSPVQSYCSHICHVARETSSKYKGNPFYWKFL
jgi:hypothetical protein